MLVVCGLGAWALSMFACSGARRAMGACQGGSGSLLETVGIALGACRKGLGACRDVSLSVVGLGACREMGACRGSVGGACHAGCLRACRDVTLSVVGRGACREMGSCRWTCRGACRDVWELVGM